VCTTALTRATGAAWRGHAAACACKHGSMWCWQSWHTDLVELNCWMIGMTGAHAISQLRAWMTMCGVAVPRLWLWCQSCHPGGVTKGIVLVVRGAGSSTHGACVDCLPTSVQVRVPFMMHACMLMLACSDDIGRLIISVVGWHMM
jgi:hypothetical protein